MKMTPEHYTRLLALVRAGMARIPSVDAYIRRDASIPRIDKANDPLKRHRWDAFWAADKQATCDMLSDDCLYGYLNDAHIDTALRRAVNEVLRGPR